MNKFNLKYKDFTDFIAVYKPEGFRTHKVSENQWGFVETLSEKIGKPLWVVHRLDKETSGIMLFAKSKESAAEISALFENHLIHKTYLFLTDCNASFKSIKISSCIEKRDNSFHSHKASPSNSETEFEWIQNIGAFQLWRALPKTGKPHQIRLHAQDAGIPILGDNEHGGTVYHRLCLHAQNLKWTLNQTDYNLESPLPPSFCQIETGLTQFFADQWFRLAQLYTWSPDQCFRLIDYSEQKIVADVYGTTLWVYWYRDQAPTASEIQEIQLFAKSKNINSVVRHMVNRGQGVGNKEQQQQITLSEQQPATWWACENSLKALLKTDGGFSPGLFLDQSENRKWVVQNSKNKNVLNLFSYTSLFSVAAGLGQAHKVTTVDASSSFLNWSKENFILNNLDPALHEFFVQDCLLFLNGSIKRNRKWDLIICDPPSFGRTKTTVWKIEKNLPDLVQALWACLAHKGTLLFTCNYENWDLDQLKDVFKRTLKGQKFKIENLPPNTMDFGFYDEKKNPTKGFFLVKD